MALDADDIERLRDRTTQLLSETTLLIQQCNSLKLKVGIHTQQLRSLFIVCGILVAMSSGVNIYASEQPSAGGGASPLKGEISPQFLELLMVLAGGGSVLYGVSKGGKSE
jgi:hypothetical protein